MRKRRTIKKELETHVCGPFILSSCCNKYTALRMVMAINDQPICGVVKSILNSNGI